MDEPYDRRAFLRRAGAACLLAPTLPILGCGSERPELGGSASLGNGPSITRPILLPWSPDAVRISAPALELPVAYVSMGRHQLFVDLEFRDRVYWELSAHISVSSGLWRIPLPGDSDRVPVQPGDPLREFEELGSHDWDPSVGPAEGDIRIQRGRGVGVRVDFSCAPLSGGDEWFSAGPWEIVQCRDPDDGLCREDFMSVGSGTRYSDRNCTRPSGTVQFVTWARREATTPAVR